MIHLILFFRGDKNVSTEPLHAGPLLPILLFFLSSHFSFPRWAPQQLAVLLTCVFAWQFCCLTSTLVKQQNILSCFSLTLLYIVCFTIGVKACCPLEISWGSMPPAALSVTLTTFTAGHLIATRAASYCTCYSLVRFTFVKKYYLEYLIGTSIRLN